MGRHDLNLIFDDSVYLQILELEVDSVDCPLIFVVFERIPLHKSKPIVVRNGNVSEKPNCVYRVYVRFGDEGPYNIYGGASYFAVDLLSLVSRNVLDKSDILGARTEGECLLSREDIARELMIEVNLISAR